MMGEDPEIRNDAVSVVQDRSKNGVYREFFPHGSIFATSVQGANEMKVTVPPETSITISTVSRELSTGTCKLRFKNSSDNADWLLLCNLHGEHPVTGLGLTCVGPDVFFLEAKGTKINVFGSVSRLAGYHVEQLETVAATDDVPMDGRDEVSSSVVAFQDHSKNGIYKESFAQGSVFATSVHGTDEMKVTVPGGTVLTLSTASREMSSGTCKLNYKGPGKDAEWHLLCKLHSDHPVTSLGITSVGPTEFVLKAPGTKINVFGSVSASRYPSNDGFLARHAKRAVPDGERPKKRSRGELNDDDDTMEEQDGECSPPQLSKKQRRRLAKKKAKELADAVAVLNMHESRTDGANVGTKHGKKAGSVTKERRLSSGVVVKDLMLGTGHSINAGRKVSIIYEGSFPSGEVFDRNKNRKNPLTFRLGTGQVVRGLEKGLEGMKVGGEREITIPPQLGYGTKGSGTVVPPNSTLVFSVQVIGTG